MDIKLDSIDFKEVFNAAILAALDDDKKNVMIQAALSHLTERPTYGNGNNKTALERAFHHALETVARDKIEEFLKEDESVNQMIEGIIVDAVKKINGEGRAKTVSSIADKIIEGLCSRGY